MARYNFSYRFKDSFKTKYHKFKKNNQNISVKLTSDAPITGQSSSRFTLRLQKRVLLVGFQTVGTEKFPRIGTKTKVFTNLKKGHYRIVLEKSTDNITVSGSGTMWN